MTLDTRHPSAAQEASAASERRIVKRYSNRKLYDTKESRYVTLAQIAEFVRAGEDIQVIDNATKEDKTEATLALIISEEVKTRPKAVPLNTLRELVHTQGEKILSQLRESPIARLFPQPLGENAAEGGMPDLQHTDDSAKTGAAETPDNRSHLQRLVESSRQTLEEWQAAIDERVAMLLPGTFRDQQEQIKQLEGKVAELERRIDMGRAANAEAIEAGNNNVS